MPLASTRMRTSPARGVGSGASRTCKTSGGPALVIQTCRIWSCLLLLVLLPCFLLQYSTWEPTGVVRDIASSSQCLPCIALNWPAGCWPHCLRKLNNVYLFDTMG